MKNLKKDDSFIDEEDEKKSNKQRKNLNKLIASCKSAPFKNNIMVEAQELFYHEKFLNLLNKNPENYYDIALIFKI